jgi:23S rRNA pseudouridine2605 synthase
MRLVKFLATSGVASRRAAEEIIRSGRVTVAGEPVTDPARDVDRDSCVALDGESVGGKPQTLVVYAVNKPSGVVSTAKDPQGRPTVVKLVRSPQRLYPVGRLDADTTGLILLTNDGELSYRLTHPRFEVEKTYRARLAGPPVAERALRALRHGIQLEDGMTAPARVRRTKPDTLEITIHEGRKRQVKRMCEAVGHRVLQLERISFGPLQLGDLALGAHRQLSGEEVRLLWTATGSAQRAPATVSPQRGPATGTAQRAPNLISSVPDGPAT